MRASKFLMVTVAFCLCVVTACERKHVEDAKTSLSQAAQKQVQPQI